MEVSEINELNLTPVVVRYEMFQDIPGEIYIPNVIRVRNNETPESCMKRLWSRELIELMKLADVDKEVDTSGCWCNDIRAMIAFDNEDYVEYWVAWLKE